MAVERIFFQSSMPRSGSTLMQNILAQNPEIHATPTSGLMDLLYGARHNFTIIEEFKHALDQDAMRKAFAGFCNSAIHGYANAITDKKYYLDKGRAWTPYIRWIEEFLPYQPKIICMVRDLRDVFCSMEKKFRKNMHKDLMIDWNEMKNTIVNKRIDSWANGVPIGIMLERIESVIQMKDEHKILFVRYEDFCLNPDREISRIYNYLEIPFFQHNFDHIPQLTHEDDNPHMGFGDHVIRNTLEMRPSDAKDVLGQYVCEWIVNRFRWYFDHFKYVI
jgi:sulfotransferase